MLNIQGAAVLIQGSKLSFFSKEPNCIFKSYLKVLSIEASTSLGFLQRFEGAPGEFEGSPASRLQLISSPAIWGIVYLSRAN